MIIEQPAIFLRWLYPRATWRMNRMLGEANDINEKWAKTQQARVNGLLQLYRSKGGSFGDED